MIEGKSTKERILDEANSLVLKKGFRATSLHDLLDVAGVKKGTLYYYFPSKDHLGLAVLERAKSEFLVTLDEILAPTSPEQSLQNFLEYVLNHHRENGFSGGCLFGNTALEMSDTSNEFARSVEDLFKTWAQRLESVLLSGQKKRVFRSDLPALELAYSILSAIEGGIMLSRLQKDEMPLKSCFNSLKAFLRGDQ